MIGLTSYRDYFASKRHGRSSKYESLCQYAYDISEALGEEIEIVPTAEIGTNATYDGYDKLLVFEHPTSFAQRENSGFTTPNVSNHLIQLEKLIAYDRDVLSCNFELQNYAKWISRVESRRKHPNTRHFNIPDDACLFSFFERLSANSVTKKVDEFKHKQSRWAIGDSHTVMLWERNLSVYPLIGRTLYGALNEGLVNLVPDHVDGVILCFGNIDLRHHLARQEDPLKVAEQLAIDYVKQAESLKGKASICELLPNISPDRPVSKSYWYKNEPHAGDITLRNDIRTRFNESLHDYATSAVILRVPKVLISDDGLLKDEVVERTRGGIHLAPQYYENTASTQNHSQENSWQPN